MNKNVLDHEIFPWSSQLHRHFRFRQTISLRFGDFGHRCFGQEQHTRDGDGVFERGPYDFGRIDNARLDKIDICLTRGVKTEIAFAAEHPRDDDTAVGGGVFRNLPGRSLKRSLEDLNASPLVTFAR
jgi:hypothetical protein